MSDRCLLLIRRLTAILLLSSPAFAAGPTFRPDVMLKGSRLAGWHVLGQADWKLQNGVLTGTAKPGGHGGWLVLDRSFQDVGFFASFKCPAGCQAGVLLRAEKTPQGMKGILRIAHRGRPGFVSRNVLDAQGQEVRREKIVTRRRSARRWSETGGPDAVAAGESACQAWNGPQALINQVSGTRSTSFWPGTTSNRRINGGRLGAGTGGIEGGPVADADGRYGPIALYAGGSIEARFENIAYKDLNARQFPKEQTSRNWRMQRLSEWYYSYAAAAADLNHDGVMDVVAGPYYYLGPDYTVAKEIYQAETFNPGTQWPVTSMTQIAYDWRGNGWPDVLIMSGNAGNGVGTLFINPKGESRRWDKHAGTPLGWKRNDGIRRYRRRR